MDIADAYPETCGLSSYLREAVLWKNKEILIRDTFSFTSCPDETPEEPAVLLNLMTCAKPVSCGTSDDVCFRIGDHIEAVSVCRRVDFTFAAIS